MRVGLEVNGNAENTYSGFCCPIFLLQLLGRLEVLLVKKRSQLSELYLRC
jgi:hypothetical protein